MTSGRVVSVVITTRDRSTLLREAVESVLAVERDGFELEIVVVDDGSVDHTPEVLAEYPVVVVRGNGAGIAAARNLGVRRSTGEFVQLLDDDDVLTRDSITCRLAVLDRHPEYGAVHGRAQRTDPDLAPFGAPVPEGPMTSGWILEDLLSYFPQIGTVLTRRDVLTEVGGFNIAFDGDDEWDLFLRTARRWPIGRTDDTVMFFRQRGEVAEEEQQWRRSLGNPDIFRTNTRHLPFPTRLRLQIRFWKLRGWHSAGFVDYAAINWREGRRRRALRSTWYALRWSPLHTPLNILRALRDGGFTPRRVAQPTRRATTQRDTAR